MADVTARSTVSAAGEPTLTESQEARFRVLERMRHDRWCSWKEQRDCNCKAGRLMLALIESEAGTTNEPHPFDEYAAWSDWCRRCDKRQHHPIHDERAEAARPSVTDLRATLERLVAAIERVHSSDEYQAAWMTAQAHRGPYNGPQYGDALDAARAALAASPAGPEAHEHQWTAGTGTPIAPGIPQAVCADPDCPDRASPAGPEPSLSDLSLSPVRQPEATPLDVERLALLISDLDEEQPFLVGCDHATDDEIADASPRRVAERILARLGASGAPGEPR